MSLRIEIVDPLPFAEVASTILQASWTAPCLHYSAEYLAWQFSFPSQLPHRAAIAFVHGVAVGCVAVTSRQFAQDGVHFSAYVLSFVAVDPAARGKGLAAQMYSSLLHTIRAETPVVAFAEPGSIGERLLLEAFAKASFQHRSLQTCRGMGYIPRSQEQDPEGLVVATVTERYDEFVSVRNQIQDDTTIWNDPTAEQWEHYKTDTRYRAMLVLRDRNNHRPVGTAMVVLGEVLSPQGLQRVPMLENVALVDNSPDALAAAFHLAAQRCQPPSMVIAPNLSCVDDSVLRESRARKIGSAFNAHLFTRSGNERLASATRTNAEVI